MPQIRSILSLPAHFLGYLAHGTRRPDWLAASPALYMLAIMLALSLFSLTSAGSSWLDSTHEYISWC